LPRRGEPAPAASAESAPAAPPREPGANPPLPRRGESGLPQRRGVDGDAGAPPLPRRDTGLPQREPGLSQRDSGLPQRESGLPQREPTRDREQHEPQDAPAAEVSSTGLPKRRPGASGISSYMPSEAPAAPAEPAPSDPLTDEWVLPESADTPARPPEQKEPRHRYRSNAAKTASFFQSRTEVPPVDGSADPTPIFADMMSNWLTDPTASDTTMGEWHSAGDEAWAAVDRVIAKPVEVDPEIGLPKRRPGERLLPGAVDDASDTGTFRKVRDPDAIRAKLSRHQQGVRNGRAGRSFGANQADRDHAPAGTGSAPAGSSTYSTGSHSTEGER
ncbi:hypothetical protein HCA44_17885, partial [Rhodococcus sp. HNM0569]|nr:hypothetical protein [Rhodococcus sp. HNM0569]